VDTETTCYEIYRTHRFSIARTPTNMQPPIDPPKLVNADRPALKPPARNRFQDSVLVQNKVAVLAVLFFVTGFLGLPLLWLSPRFSKVERWMWAILNTIYTCTLIWIVFKICVWSWTRISSGF
jgi:hypothetical protein